MPCTVTAQEISCPLEGVPEVRGNFSIAAELTDARGDTVRKIYRLNIKPNRVPGFVTKRLSTAQIGVAFLAEITAADSDTADTITLSINGFPPGLRWENCSGSNPASCQLTGTPTSRGTYQIMVTAEDQYGGSVLKRYTIKVR